MVVLSGSFQLLEVVPGFWSLAILVGELPGVEPIYPFLVKILVQGKLEKGLESGTGHLELGTSGLPQAGETLSSSEKALGRMVLREGWQVSESDLLLVERRMELVGV
jgi:hypothetical protein